MFRDTGKSLIIPATITLSVIILSVIYMSYQTKDQLLRTDIEFLDWPVTPIAYITTGYIEADKIPLESLSLSGYKGGVRLLLDKMHRKNLIDGFPCVSPAHSGINANIIISTNGCVTKPHIKIGYISDSCFVFVNARISSAYGALNMVKHHSYKKPELFMINALYDHVQITHQYGYYVNIVNTTIARCIQTLFL